MQQTPLFPDLPVSSGRPRPGPAGLRSKSNTPLSSASAARAPSLASSITKSNSRPRPKRTATWQMCVLGSGSGGNATVLRSGDKAILIDAGLTPRTLRQRLDRIGMSLTQVQAICVTHLDQDHFKPSWITWMLRERVPLFVGQFHQRFLERLPHGPSLLQADLVQSYSMQTPAIELMDGLSLSPLALPHDDKCTVGFRGQCESGSFGFATDLGAVPRELIQRFADVDLLAIESNYDPRMQLASSRPQFLKQRIMNGRGHLSNEQAFDAVCQIVDRSQQRQPRHIVLLHRSRQCNDVQRIHRVFAQRLDLADKLVLTDQHKHTRWLDICPAKTTQLSLKLG